MAIQIRRGNYNDFDDTRMRQGELAVCLDNGYVFVTLSPGHSVRLGTAETIADAVELAEKWAVGTVDGEPVDPSDPTYHNNSKYYAQSSGVNASDAEAWAVGKRGGQDVPSTDPAYHNNAKYIADNVGVSVTEQTSASDTRIGCQIININASSYIVSGSIYMQQTVSLTANTPTVITFTNDVITVDSAIDVWADVFGISPTNIVTTNGHCDITFEHSSDITLTCRIYIRY